MTSRTLLVILLCTPSGVAGQVATVGGDEPQELSYSGRDVRGAAQDAQARFERIRLRHAPLSFRSGGGDCDEYVGRFCTTYGEGEWYPRSEAEEVTAARVELLAELDSLQELGSADTWILGQRVWYRADGGDWAEALEAAGECVPAGAWWCPALRGLALHGLGRYTEALTAFEAALAQMDPDMARDWRVPEQAVHRGVRGDLRDSEELHADSLTAALSTLWGLADPLYLVPGNDRLTAHYARWTVANIKSEARNPYGLSWGGDLEELTVRHGWELGWERTRSTVSMGRDGAIGHKHPEGRDYLPREEALRDPVNATAEELAADRRQPRSLYAPPYAPVLLPIEAEVAVFPRGDHAVLVATPYLPDDTTFHSSHDHPRPWMEAGDQGGLPDEIGFFALSPGAGAPVARRKSGWAEGALMLEVPLGDYAVSVESWSPERRLAGRLRKGVRIERTPEDVATLSDLLILGGAGTPTTSLEEVLPRVLVRSRIGPTDPTAIAWEVAGLGFRPESLQYVLSVERTDRNVFRRIGEFFGLGDRPRPLALTWQEPSPDHPSHQFRHLELDLPPLDPGHYEITLTLQTTGRSDVTVTKRFEVVGE